MIKNHFVLFLRTIRRSTVYFLLNTIGLGIGIASVILVLVFVQDELSYDRYHEKADQVYRVTTHETAVDQQNTYATTTSGLAPALVNEIPEIIAAVRFIPFGRGLPVQAGERQFFEDNYFYADSTVFDVFSFRFIYGVARQALTRPNTVVFTESAATKYFGNVDPLGQTITINYNRSFEVTGVIEDVPHNSHLRFDFLLSINTINAFRPGFFDSNWMARALYTYALVTPGFDPATLDALSQRVAALGYRHGADISQQAGFSRTLDIQPLVNIHLRSHLEQEMSQNGRIEFLFILSAIGMLVLLIGCVNCINLMTAQSLRRAKEIGIRKVLGAHRGQLIKQFLIESVLLAGGALLLALVLCSLALPAVNELSGKDLSPRDLFTSTIVLAMIVCTIGTGLLSGAYPALFLSSYQPVKVLRGALNRGRGGILLREGLIVVQFAISTLLIIGAGVIYLQLSYLESAELGFDKEELMALRLTNSLIQVADFNPEVLKRELEGVPGVRHATLSQRVPTEIDIRNTVARPEGMPLREGIPLTIYGVDHEYIQTLGMRIVEGRDFSRAFASDSAAVIINGAALRQFGWQEPIGKRLFNPNDTEAWGTVIGVIQDFNHGSFRSTAEPIVLFLGTSRPRYLVLKLRANDLLAVRSAVENRWRDVVGDFPIDHFFLEDQYATLYQSDEKIGAMVGFFALLAIGVACMGLYGLASFITVQRTKEIAIRKVFGASDRGVVADFLRSFNTPVIIAVLIGVAPAYYFANEWLTGFAFHIAFPVWILPVALLLLLGVATTTVVFHTVRVAATNPAEMLRYE